MEMRDLFPLGPSGSLSSVAAEARFEVCIVPGMNKITAIAQLVVVGCLLAAVVAITFRPTHWDRTFLAAIVVGAIAGFVVMLKRKGSADS